MVALKDRLSLDWLKEAQRGPTSRGVGVESVRGRGVLTPNLEDAVLAYGRPLLRALSEKPGRTARLHDLVKEMRLQLRDALPVVEHLVDRGHLQVIEDDPVANYNLYLTDQGAKLLR